MPGGQPDCWAIHIGAHKTASTHFQMALRENGDHLRTRGVTYLPVKVARPVLSKSQLGRWERRFSRLLPAAREGLEGRAMRRVLLDGSPAPGRLLISEENLLGLTQNFGAGALYPSFDRLTRVVAAAGRAPVELFLAVRSLDGYLPSLYAEAVKYRQFDRQVFKDRVDDLLGDPHPWSDLVGRLSAAFPKATLRVWRYEDYDGNWQEVFRAFAGCAPAVPPSEARPVLTRTPSGEAVRAAEALPGTYADGRARAVRDIYAADILSGQHPRFDPLTDTEKERFRAAYREDIDRIRQRHPGVVMEF